MPVPSRLVPELKLRVPPFRLIGPVKVSLAVRNKVPAPSFVKLAAPMLKPSIEVLPAPPTVKSIPEPVIAELVPVSMVSVPESELMRVAPARVITLALVFVQRLLPPALRRAPPPDTPEPLRVMGSATVNPPLTSTAPLDTVVVPAVVPSAMLF